MEVVEINNKVKACLKKFAIDTLKITAAVIVMKLISVITGFWNDISYLFVWVCAVFVPAAIDLITLVFKKLLKK